MELARVRDALGRLTVPQRDVLLAEVGEAQPVAVSGAALKMTRMRARARLRALIEEVSALVSTRVSRIRNLFETIDSAVVNAASGVAAQVAAVLVVGAVLPSFQLGSQQAPRDALAMSVPPAISVADLTSTSGAAPAFASGLFTSGAVRSRHLSLAPRVKDERMNQNFGPVHTDGSNVTVGDEGPIGPYGTEQEVAPHTGGDKILMLLRARYDSPGCRNRLRVGPPEGAACTEAGKVATFVKARYGKTEKHFEFDSKKTRQ
jgi:hypothetical protein